MSQLAISTQHCIVTAEDRVMTVTLNRPEARNAFTPAMMVAMYRAWRHLDQDDGLLCAILTGNGDTFCAGMDLKRAAREDEAEDEKEVRRLLKEVPDLHWQALLRCKQPLKPIVLAVEGYALAGGTEILQGTDIRVGAEDAVFGVTEIKRALFPLGGSTIRLRRQIPYALAAEMLLLGRHVSAQEALRFGLINRVVPKGQTMQAAREIAAELCENGPLALKAIVRSLRENDIGMDESEALDRELEIGWPVFSTADAKEGMKAFAEKRKPNYQGR